MQADIVKKSSLKLKVFRSKNGSGPAGVLQGPKVFKEFWFVFRALIGGDKILEYHQNEKKFQECAAYPKGVLHLESALAVSYHNPEKKQQFSIELAGGSIIFLEATSQSLAREWMNCLNAVLFGKGSGPNGALQYFAEVPVGNRLQYAGACMLEVKDEELIIKTNDGSANLVRWKLAHIRSFKAKKDMLTVYSGSRSSTGVGEYHFKTTQSVQITHAIETVVKRLKYEALGSNQQMMIPHHSTSHTPGINRDRPFNSERRRPLPPPPPPSHPAPPPSITPPRTQSPSDINSLSSSMAAAVPDHLSLELLGGDDNIPQHGHNRQYIPDFRTPEYSTVDTVGPPEYSTVDTVGPPEYSTVDTVGPDSKGYEKLDHGGVKGNQQTIISHTAQDDEGYSHLSHASSQMNTSRSRSVSHSPPPRHISAPNDDYGRLDHGIEGQNRNDPNDNGYGRLDHGLGGVHTVIAPSDGDYGKLDHGVDHGSNNTPSGNDDYSQLQHHDINTRSDDNHSKLATPSPGDVLKKKPPVVPPPYKPPPGSTIPNIISRLNASKIQCDSTPLVKEGDIYSEVAPSIPHSGVSEGYSRLKHGGQSTPVILQPSPVESVNMKTSRSSGILRPQSIIDPYASLTNDDISDAIRSDTLIPPPTDGTYSKLGQCLKPNIQIDSKGYSKPWTSYTQTLNDPTNDTPKPSLDGTDQNGTKTRDPLNGIETAAEDLYDKVSDGEIPPTPPPRTGSRRSHSPHRWNNKQQQQQPPQTTT